MAVNIKSVHNLQTGSNKKWKNLPTKAIRVPGVFAEKILQIARDIDTGKSISYQDVYMALEALSIQELFDNYRRTKYPHK
ncbi:MULTISPECIES: hypothetical protein [unclassified Okeania]|uniref:hypothetical protein n=1 Tax=unclassified Okeania TaxID=2634635 RepID=UPI0013C0BFE0|nr:MULTISPECIES: hypothetical protein [unclassified Okeania]NET46892.1 hypothetical protein [Okeania sp. SIO2B3]GGA11621.1 hypothetical protein CYANOKiyG1_24630 [Okeania sp. KiyG1]